MAQVFADAVPPSDASVIVHMFLVVYTRRAVGRAQAQASAVTSPVEYRLRRFVNVTPRPGILIHYIFSSVFVLTPRRGGAKFDLFVFASYAKYN